MGGRVVLGLLAPLLLLVVGIAVVRLVSARGLDPVAARARWRSGATTGATAVVAGLVVAVPGPTGDDVRLATLPAAAATAGIVASAVAERLWPRPAGPTRIASLAASRADSVRDTRRLRSMYAAGLALAAVVLGVGAVTAAPDGRSVSRSYADGAAAASPYPGPAYGLPVGVALVTLALATWWALREVEARPALLGASTGLDLAVRVTSRVRVLRYAAAGSLASGAGLALTAGAALNSLVQTVRMNDLTAPRAPWDWTQNAAFALVGAGVVAVLGVAVALLWGAPQIPRSRPVPEVAEALDRTSA